MRRLAVLAVLSATVLIAQPQPRQPEARKEGAYWVRSYDGSLPARGVETLRISGSGNLTVRGGEGDEIRYSVRHLSRNRATGPLETRARVTGKVATVAFGDWAAGARHGRVDAELVVPRNLKLVNATTPAGAITVRSLQGVVEAETGGGHVELDEIGGTVLVTTAGGDVVLGRIGGRAHCVSRGGSIRATEVGGDAVFESAGGEITVSRVRGTLRASTGGGNIYVKEATREVRAATGSGLVKIGGAEGVRVATGSGAIFLDGISGALNAATGNGSIQATLLRGSTIKNSQLQTAAGDITVFIPSDLAVTVRAHNRSGVGMRNIISEFSEIRVKLNESSEDLPLVQAEGSLNGGGPVLQVLASGGTIYLRKRNNR
jgi:DUF4097 and DUF4098 domain-containing protein YvlB